MTSPPASSPLAGQVLEISFGTVTPAKGGFMRLTGRIEIT
jgi:hypothetical protein